MSAGSEPTVTNSPDSDAPLTSVGVFTHVHMPTHTYRNFKKMNSGTFANITGDQGRLASCLFQVWVGHLDSGFECKTGSDYKSRHTVVGLLWNFNTYIGEAESYWAPCF